MLLGAVLAGGQSRRFGSDKAVATFESAPLIEHVIAALQVRTSAIVVCGRVMAGYTSLADRPHAGLGPLGGLAAALDYARQHGFDAVLTAPCDTPRLTDDLLAGLVAAGSPVFVAASPVVGVWPASLAQHLDRHLAESDDRSVRRWALAVGARPIELGDVANINTVEDLRQLSDG